MPETPADPLPPFRFGAVILAAGGSSRMGAVKQLLELDGRSLIGRAVDAARAAQAHTIVVVLGAEAEKVRAPNARYPILTELNPEWPEGLSSSIRRGVRALLDSEPDLNAVLLTPCDQPALSAEIIAQLASLQKSTGRIAAARYDGRNGAPAVFGRGHFERLQTLTGDEGARKLLNTDPDGVVTLDCPAMGFDLDTPSDYANWKNRPS
jgi:CTP:molybdopterin cytidylyltransferase MocA